MSCTRGGLLPIRAQTAVWLRSVFCIQCCVCVCYGMVPTIIDVTLLSFFNRNLQNALSIHAFAIVPERVWPLLLKRRGPETLPEGKSAEKNKCNFIFQLNCSARNTDKCIPKGGMSSNWVVLGFLVPFTPTLCEQPKQSGSFHRF